MLAIGTALAREYLAERHLQRQEGAPALTHIRVPISLVAVQPRLGRAQRSRAAPLARHSARRGQAPPRAQTASAKRWPTTLAPRAPGQLLPCHCRSDRAPWPSMATVRWCSFVERQPHAPWCPPGREGATSPRRSRSARDVGVAMWPKNVPGATRAPAPSSPRLRRRSARSRLASVRAALEEREDLERPRSGCW
jgi:hypothetical protein